MRRERNGVRLDPIVLSVVLLLGCAEAHEVDAGLDARADLADAGPDAGTTVLDAGAGDAGDAAPARHEPFFDFCVRQAMIYCRGARDCCDVIDRTRDVCTADRFDRFCNSLAADPALRDGTLRWHDAEATAHLDVLETRLATCSRIDRHFSFGQFVEGTLAEGDDCTPYRSHLDSLGRLRCQAGLRCELTGTSGDYTGRCTPLGVAGDSCNDECAEGFYCQWWIEELEPGELGEPFWGHCEAVDPSSPCRGDLACPSSVYCELGVCEEPSDANSWCGFLL